MRDYDSTVKNLREAAKGLLFDAMPYRASVMRDAADAIEELLAVVPHWISVEERLPEDQGDDARAARGGDYIHKVLAASVTPNYTVMDTAYLENGIWSLSQYTSWKQIIGAPVTHWMPLPDPPKEVE